MLRRVHLLQASRAVTLRAALLAPICKRAQGLAKQTIPEMPPRTLKPPKPTPPQTAPTAPPRPPPTDLAVLPFCDPPAFDSFLSASHSTSPGIYLRLAKKSCPDASITYSEALELALAYGWIDGLALPHCAHWHLRRFTPRRPRSAWSARNVVIAERLIADGRMRASGLEAVEKAKADGRWERAYAGMSAMEVPEDLKAALKAGDALDAFEALAKGERYALILRVENGAPETRAKRIEGVVKGLVGHNVELALNDEASGKTASSSDKSKKAQQISKKRKAAEGEAPEDGKVKALRKSKRSVPGP